MTYEPFSLSRAHALLGTIKMINGRRASRLKDDLLLDTMETMYYVIVGRNH